MATPPSEPDQACALVTGLRGFTGRHVAAELTAAGYQVVGLEGDAGFNRPKVDLSNRAQVIDAIAQVQPDVVIHLAAIAFVAHGDNDAIYQTNLIGARHLLEGLAACSKQPKAVILASSANVYGNAQTAILDESCPPQPANDYAVSKIAMEYMARLWFDKLPIMITRPFNYTGVGQSLDFLIPKIVRHFADNAEEIELGNINVWRDFSDVRDIARAYRALIAHGMTGETYNLCSGTAWSLGEVLALMTDIAGYRIKVNVNPAFVRANEVKKLVGSRSKLDTLLGHTPITSLPETLRWMYEARIGS